MGKLCLTLNQFSNCHCYTSSAYLLLSHVLVIISYILLIRMSFNRFILKLHCFSDWYVLGTCKSKYDIISLICWKEYMSREATQKTVKFNIVFAASAWWYDSNEEAFQDRLFNPISNKKISLCCYFCLKKKTNKKTIMDAGVEAC